MFYGEFSFQALENESEALNRLQKAMEWEGCEHHQVVYKGFAGGFFLDSRLPFTIDDCLYIDTENDLLVLISGCIYNRAEISQVFNTTIQHLPEPALIAHLYALQGIDFVNNLNGDFAIFVYDARKNTFFLCRDHVGIVPLVYTVAEQFLYFSTDIIALCRAFDEGERLNMDALISDYKVVDMTLTPNDKVLKLKAGHYLKSNEKDLIIRKYWEPERVKTDNTLTQPQIFEELKSLLEEAVQIRSDKRFRAGAHLSGGFDSSIVAVLARKEFADQKNFYGYSWSPANSTPDKDSLDERELVKETCRMAGIEPAFIHIEVSDFVELSKNAMQNFMYVHEEKVLDMAQLHQTNLIFSGWGGDEFISFGSLGVDSDLFFNFQWKTFFRKNPLKDPKKIASYLIYRIFFPAINFIPFRVKKSFDEMLRHFKREHTQFHQKTYKLYYCYRSRREYQLGLLKTHHLPERTECWAITGYKRGAVYRYPLLDRRIIEYVLKIPSKLLVKDSKYTRIILREISEGLLPESVRWRLGKTDAAFFSLVNQQTLQRGLLFMDEIEEFKKNPDLYFIDFEVLERGIKEFKENKNYKDSTKLCGDILAFKMFHEFTKSYRAGINKEVIT
ncbi:asparagine synthase-related protein [Runella salmonicolor]|uniref:asparagine synthase (glutamine-hydrolyzing) n=1 Tax=Runella salmonicolor TaxID=2950278 RepID=A0ABT1FHJ3_9BACT|nr:asparagine synthase-related protein [Runella salmonicolor]MCP1381192.1 asparagine synthase-related protein [Runella salmonicolor]